MPHFFVHSMSWIYEYGAGDLERPVDGKITFSAFMSGKIGGLIYKEGESSSRTQFRLYYTFNTL